MYKVAILAYQGLATFEFGCAIELFGLPRPEYDQWYRAEVVTFDKSPVAATGGFLMSAKPVTSLSSYHTLIIPGWPTHQCGVSELIKQQLVKLYRRGGRIISFCSGAFLLAELGLLDGRCATTHWRYAALFQQRYPQVNYQDNVLYMFDGQIGCSAGSAAGIDLGIEVIRQDFGYVIANQVARRLVVSPHRSGGQAQYVETPVIKHHSQFSATLDWAIEHLQQPLIVNDLAEQAHMSRRSFDRHFRQALGMSAKEWINRQRLTLAQKQLEKGAVSVEQIAIRVGFGNAMNLRHYFRKYLGLSPTQYQGQFFSQ
ncbi:helix-turn-helix domain-containing protein [Endozoicomonas sp. SM1973]|uniref:Helix-turn-helix domain-containing protein n=1 Tax=Spartinivicinus marinus TaxID=2994442 RepID=A0A853IC46_9GAMM|nr:helix-turn-helix domain-containing protein [Spartinivicinus marinus]MCX4028416.1 helix-turn-helix domain-containing protein [Spartinivicinus marinus]NYZ67471.1 helix-turn-helix domain-containing protein [Spartinivicinus marinus]